MNKIKQLQNKLKSGKITQEEYNQQLKALLDSEDITQEEYDGTKDFEVDDPGEKLIYSQNDVDRLIGKKSTQRIRKILKDAGVDLEGVKNHELDGKLSEYLTEAGSKGQATADEKELKVLRTKADKADALEGTVKNLTLENSVLKAAGKYKPADPTGKQLVRALNDYADLLDYDEDGNLEGKSVDKAIKRIAEAEPNLFEATGEDGEGDDDKGGNAGGGGTFSGKKPGGAGAGTGKKDKELEANRNRSREALIKQGILKPEQK